NLSLGLMILLFHRPLLPVPVMNAVQKNVQLCRHATDLGLWLPAQLYSFFELLQYGFSIENCSLILHKMPDSLFGISGLKQGFQHRCIFPVAVGFLSTEVCN